MIRRGQIKPLLLKHRQLCAHRCTCLTHAYTKQPLLCGVSLRLHIFQIPEAVKAQSVQQDGGWASHLHHRKSTAKQSLAFSCTAVVQTLRKTAAFALHPDHTRTESRDPWPHGAQWGKTRPRLSVWVLTWMRTQSRSDSCRVEQGGLCGDPHPVWRNARRKQPQQNTYFLCSLAREGGGWGPLLIVRHNTGISVCRHLQQIRTGNSVPYSPVNKAAPAQSSLL